LSQSDVESVPVAEVVKMINECFGAGLSEAIATAGELRRHLATLANQDDDDTEDLMKQFVEAQGGGGQQLSRRRPARRDFTDDDRAKLGQEFFFGNGAGKGSILN
jgi:hypothetical protein